MCPQFLHRERFWNVIISTYIKPCDPVRFTGSGTCKYNRNIRYFSQFTTHFKPDSIRQINIENNEMKAFICQNFKRFLAASSISNSEPLIRKHIHNDHSNIYIIIYYQDFPFHDIFSNILLFSFRNSYMHFIRKY